MKKILKALISAVLSAVLLTSSIGDIPVNTVVCASAASGKLAAPTNIKTSKITKDSIKLTWSAVNGADSYRVFIYDDFLESYEKYKDYKSTYCTVKDLSPTTNYKFKVAAIKKIDGKKQVQTMSSAVSASTKGEVITFSGSGTDITRKFTLSAPIYMVELSNKGNHNFIVTLYDDTGKRYSSLANEIGDYKGKVIFNEVNPNRKYYLEVKSKGSWKITFTTDFGFGTSNLYGNGDCVSPWFELEDDVQFVNLSYSGKHNFIVTLYDDTGKRYSSLANEIGSYKARTVFDESEYGTKYCIRVVSSGKWSVDFGETSKKTELKP